MFIMIQLHPKLLSFGRILGLTPQSLIFFQIFEPKENHNTILKIDLLINLFLIRTIQAKKMCNIF